MTIRLETQAGGIVLAVRAHAGARRSGIQGEQNGMLKVSVTQVPERGKANKAMVAVLCKELSLRPSQIEIVSGHSGSRKRFLITGIDQAELARRIAQVLT